MCTKAPEKRLSVLLVMVQEDEQNTFAGAPLLVGYELDWPPE